MRPAAPVLGYDRDCRIHGAFRIRPRVLLHFAMVDATRHNDRRNGSLLFREITPEAPHPPVNRLPVKIPRQN